MKGTVFRFLFEEMKSTVSRERERVSNGVIFFGEGGINKMKDKWCFLLFFFIQVLTSKDTYLIEYGT